jgi:hypothetical protein
MIDKESRLGSAADGNGEQGASSPVVAPQASGRGPSSDLDDRSEGPKENPNPKERYLQEVNQIPPQRQSQGKTYPID